MLYIVALVLAAVGVSSNVVHTGNCPDLKPVANFNLTAYQGLWYEVSKYPYKAETKGKCATAEYTLDGQTAKVKNSHVVDGVKTSIEGTVNVASDAGGSGKLVVSLKFGDKTRESQVSVLTTDYNNYAIAYRCQYDETNKNHEDFAWILSRSKTLEGDAKMAVDNFVKATPQLDATKFLQTDFSEEACKFNSSAIITEPPMPATTAKPAA